MEPASGVIKWIYASWYNYIYTRFTTVTISGGFRRSNSKNKTKTKMPGWWPSECLFSVTKAQAVTVGAWVCTKTFEGWRGVVVLCSVYSRPATTLDSPLRQTAANPSCAVSTSTRYTQSSCGWPRPLSWQTPRLTLQVFTNDIISNTNASLRTTLSLSLSVLLCFKQRSMFLYYVWSG